MNTLIKVAAFGTATNALSLLTGAGIADAEASVFEAPLLGWKGALDYFEAGDVVGAKQAVNYSYGLAQEIELAQFDITALALTTAQQAVTGARATRT